MNAHKLSRVFLRCFALRNPSRGVVSASEPRFSNHDEFTTRAEDEVRAKEQLRQKLDEEDLLKKKLLEKGLTFVSKYGWSHNAVAAAAQDLGYPSTLSSIIEKPDVSLIHFHYKRSNELLEKSMQEQLRSFADQGLPLKIGPFLRKNVEARLRMNIPFIARWTEAMAIRSQPPNALESLNLSLQLVDTLWHYAGDKSTDTNWYTKRVSALVIYKTTEIAMTQDTTEDFSNTWNFLNRRFEDHFYLSSSLATLPADLSTVLGGLESTVKTILGVPR